MDIIISNSSGDSIYKQIVDQIQEMILTGKLKEGEALPSMRLLAKELRISVITTKRAYEELESMGLIESYTGKGSFVKGQNMELLKEKNLKDMEKNLQEACEKAKLCGVSLKEMKEILDIMYEEGSDG